MPSAKKFTIVNALEQKIAELQLKLSPTYQAELNRQLQEATEVLDFLEKKEAFFDAIGRPYADLEIAKTAKTSKRAKRAVASRQHTGDSKSTPSPTADAA